jgi:hypothetical protein
MSKISFTQLPTPGTVFGPGLFDASIGQAFLLSIDNLTVETTMISAVVSPDGTSAEITLDVPGMRYLGGDGS